jgi:hypothetical protein
LRFPGRVVPRPGAFKGACELCDAVQVCLPA